MSTKTKAAKMKRRRLKEKDKIAFEKQLVREGKIYPRAHYMPRGRFRSILAICLAFFFGIFAGVGALVGTGAYFGLTKKTKDLLGGFGLPADKYLEEAYLDMTVLELLDAVRQDLGAFGGFTTLTLNVYAKYTPIVGDAVDSLTEQLKTSLGVEFNKDELMNETFGTIVPYFTENIKAVPLGKVLKAMGQDPLEDPNASLAEEVPTPSENENEGSEGEGSEGSGSESSGQDMHALLRVLCYGTAGVDYEVDENGSPVYDENGEVVMLGESTPTTIGDLLGGKLQTQLDKVQTLRLGEIITIDEKASPIMQKLRDMTIQDMQDDETIQNFKIKEIIDVKDGEKGLLNAIADFTIGDLNKPKKIERLRLSDIMDIGESSSKIMQAMKDWRIGDLTSQKKIDSLTLSDVMEIGDGNGILNAIRDTPIGKLETTIGTLSLGEILGEDSGAKNNKILKCLLNSTIDTLSFDVDKLTVGQVFGDEVFSYMENKTVNDVVHDYNYLFKSYFGEQEGKPGSYNYELYNYNQKKLVNGKYEEDSNATLYRPTAVADKSGILTKYQDASKNEVVKGYFTYDETTKLYTHYTDDKEFVKYNAANNKTNQTPVQPEGGGDPALPTDQLPIYYYEQEYDLYPVYGFGIVDETTGGFAPITNVNTSGEEPTFEMEVPAEEGEGTVTVTYTIHQKGNGDYVYGTYTEEGEFEAVGDIERYILGYVTDEAHTDLDFEVVYGAKEAESEYRDINDATVYLYEADGTYGEDSKAIEVHTRRPAAVPPQTGEGEEEGGAGSAGEPQAHSEGEEAPYYYSEPINLYEKWHLENNTETTVDDKDVTEVYVSEDGSTTYSRYLSGVWYMLLGGEDEEGNPVVNDTVPVTQMDQMVTGVTDTMQDTILARLWFHGIVQENPFVEFTFLQTLKDLGAKDHTLELEVPVLKGNSKIPYDEQQYPTEQGYTNKGGFVYQKKTITNLVQIGLGDLVTVMQRINEMLASISKE